MALVPGFASGSAPGYHNAPPGYPDTPPGYHNAPPDSPEVSASNLQVARLERSERRGWGKTLAVRTAPGRGILRDMVIYRREKVPGATWFFTVTLADRRSSSLVDHVGEFLSAYRQVSLKRGHRTDALVVMPEHLHAIWTLPAGDSDFASRWAIVKRRFLERLPASARSPWQSRFWEHRIRDEADLARHIDYIHYNPVKHGYAERPADWPWSTFNRYIRMGWVSRDWGAMPEVFGE